MTEQESLQNQFDQIQEELKEIARLINRKGYKIINNKVIKLEPHPYVLIETAYFGEYYSDQQLYISLRQFEISDENKEFFIERLKGINSLESLKEVNDSYYLLSEEYLHLNEQPLSLFYSKSDNEFELSGININLAKAEFRQLKYCNIKFLREDVPVEKISRTIEIRNSDCQITPKFYPHDSIDIIHDFKSK